MRESCGRRFDLQAVARVSHFSAREIRLEEQWYRQDIGPVIVTTKERGVPVVCLPRGAGRYVAYDLTAKTKQRVTPAYAATLEDRGTMFYRPFPAKKLGLWDLVRFGFSQTYRRDWLATWAMALVGVLIGLLLPTAAQLLYDRLIPLGEYQPVFQMGAALLACVLGNLAFTLVKNFTAFRSTSSLRYAVQNAVYDRLFRLPVLLAMALLGWGSSAMRPASWRRTPPGAPSCTSSSPASRKSASPGWRTGRCASTWSPTPAPRPCGRKSSASP